MLGGRNVPSCGSLCLVKFVRCKTGQIRALRKTARPAMGTVSLHQECLCATVSSGEVSTHHQQTEVALLVGRGHHAPRGREAHIAIGKKWLYWVNRRNANNW